VLPHPGRAARGDSSVGRLSAVTRPIPTRAAGTLVALVMAVGAACGSPDRTQRAEPAPRSGAAVEAAPTSPVGSGEAVGEAVAAEPLVPPGWRPAPLQWDDCGRGQECATLVVPLDWSLPDGPTVDLAVGRVRATGRSSGAVVVNPGGPGASGIDFLRGGAVSDRVARQFDQVSWDPRGVGRSVGVRCADEASATFLATDPSPDDPTEQAALDAAAVAVAGSCSPDVPGLLSHVGTLDAARDLEALRRALGDAPLDYVGFSYGSAIGQAYLALFPAAVRTMVLDAVVDPAEGFEEFLTAQAVAFESALRSQAARCGDAGRRACGVDDLVAAYDEVAARVESAPVASAGGPVGPAEVATAALATLYRTDGWRDLGPALADTLEGRGTPVRRLAEGFWNLTGFGAYAAVVCTDTAPPPDPEAHRRFAERLRRTAPRFGASIANELLPCASWPTAPNAAPLPTSAAGAPPTLVIGTTGDPATPLDNAERVARRLPGAVLVTVEGDGHTAYGTLACVDRIVDAYLLERALPEGPTTCRR
jgi:pimeloyl-ACP methyl ester carboxylesterase